MGGTIRSFLAIELSEELKEALEEVRYRLDLPQFHVRWVQPKNMHLTLRFLGEIQEQDVQRASQAASNAAAKGAPFRMAVLGLGAFPSLNSPRVVWVGIDESRPLLRLEKALSQELELAHFPLPDKTFRPHLTLGRVKSQRGKGELKRHLERNQQLSVGQMNVKHFSLIKSELKPSGPVYTQLNRFAL